MKKKYKDKNDFAEKIMNDLPFMKTMNIKVKVSDYTTSFIPRNGDSFFGGFTPTLSFMDKLSGMIDGLKYGYEILKGVRDERD
jgi:hypothetical protein